MASSYTAVRKAAATAATGSLTSATRPQNRAILRLLNKTGGGHAVVIDSEGQGDSGSADGFKYIGLASNSPANPISKPLKEPDPDSDEGDSASQNSETLSARNQLAMAKSAAQNPLSCRMRFDAKFV